MIILTVIIVLLVCLAPVYEVASADSLSDKPVILLSGTDNGDRTVTVSAKLIRNSGVSDLVLDLDYPTEAMTLIGLTRGDALPTLEMIHTGTNTEQGYGIMPFKLMYDLNGKSYDNDHSTGVLVNLQFKVKDEVKNGKYTVTFRNTTNCAIYYENYESYSKNIIVDPVIIEVKPGGLDVRTESGDSKNNTVKIVAISVSSTAAVAIIIVAAVLIKRKRLWTKI